METDLSRKGQRMLSLIAAQSESGRSVSLFCRTHRMSPQKFWWWKRRFQKTHRSLVSIPEKAFPFVRVLPSSPPNDHEHYELRFGDGRLLRLPGNLAVPSLVQIVLGTSRQ